MPIYGGVIVTDEEFERFKSIDAGNVAAAPEAEVAALDSTDAPAAVAADPTFDEAIAAAIAGDAPAADVAQVEAAPVADFLRAGIR